MRGPHERDADQQEDERQDLPEAGRARGVPVADGRAQLREVEHSAEVPARDGGAQAELGGSCAVDSSLRYTRRHDMTLNCMLMDLALTAAMMPINLR